MLLRRATMADLPTVSGLLAASAEWMHAERGGDAWRREGFPDHRLTPGLVEATIWLLHDGDQPVATFALDHHPDPEFTAPEAVKAGITARLPDGMVLHRLAVDRARAGQGIGPLLLDWAVDYVHRAGHGWLFLNSGRHAYGLHAFYRRNGFEPLVTVASTGRKSGALWQRPARPVPGIADRITETT